MVVSIVFKLKMPQKIARAIWFAGWWILKTSNKTIKKSNEKIWKIIQSFTKPKTSDKNTEHSISKRKNLLLEKRREITPSSSTVWGGSQERWGPNSKNQHQMTCYSWMRTRCHWMSILRISEATIPYETDQDSHWWEELIFFWVSWFGNPLRQLNPA